MRISYKDIQFKEYANNFNWNLRIMKLPILPIEFELINKEINLYCESSDVPSSTSTTTSLFNRGLYTNQVISSKPNGSINLTMFDNDKYQISKYFETWKDLIRDENNLKYSKQDLMLDKGFNLILNNNLGVAKLKYFLYDTYPSQVIIPKVIQDGSIRKFNVTIIYSYFDKEYLL
jgi:hypothetical protein